MHNYIKQFEFEHWSNTLIIKALRSLKEPADRALFLFSHLLNSHSMWHSRVSGTQMKVSLFEERTLDACEKLMDENLNAWKTFLQQQTYNDLQASIEFMAAWETKPSKRKIIIEDAIIHLINHSSYHRGQIIASIKGKVDYLPLSTYIIYASQVLTNPP
jgi:uncharacterized damage-inducible protein DinB